MKQPKPGDLMIPMNPGETEQHFVCSATYAQQTSALAQIVAGLIASGKYASHYADRFENKSKLNAAIVGEAEGILNAVQVAAMERSVIVVPGVCSKTTRALPRKKPQAKLTDRKAKRATRSGSALQARLVKLLASPVGRGLGAYGAEQRAITQQCIDDFNALSGLSERERIAVLFERAKAEIAR